MVRLIMLAYQNSYCNYIMDKNTLSSVNEMCDLDVCYKSSLNFDQHYLSILYIGLFKRKVYS